ncbi:glutathione S-transferase 1-like [Hyposmocoma kahamanoa]|uniref:glutathione S-transferase 1-like n=1 Tax=Hyposmocoma kahamanoa TaxID=1477025 RepID=UPI000E6D84A6|nr:glutathione S-transferase 1-like [Hyposmocoma kahamanoa]
MALKLYKMDISPPARAAMAICDILNVPVEMIDINLQKKEHWAPEFLRKNPLHSVPVLEDGDFVLHDSHAILAYLVDAYASNDNLYPKNIKKRALVNQKLFFDNGILFQRLRNVTYEAFVEGITKVPLKKQKDIEEAYGFLEQFLSQTKWLAGENMTIADISAYAVTASMLYIVKLDSKKYPKTLAWLDEMRKQPFNMKYSGALAQFGNFLENTLELEK